MIRPPCMTTICGAALLVIVAAAPAAASGDALTFVDRPTIDSQTRVIDVRDQKSCEKVSLAGARCLPAAELFESDGRPVGFHTLRWLLGTVGLSGNERVLVVGADVGDATAVGALLFLAGQRTVDVLNQPMTAPPKRRRGQRAQPHPRGRVHRAHARPTAGGRARAGEERRHCFGAADRTPRRFARGYADATQPVRLRLSP